MDERLKAILIRKTGSNFMIENMIKYKSHFGLDRLKTLKVNKTNKHIIEESIFIMKNLLNVKGKVGMYIPNDN